MDFIPHYGGYFKPPPSVSIKDLVEPKVKEHIQRLENQVVNLSEENRQLKQRLALYEDYKKVVSMGSRMRDLAYEIEELFSD